MITSGAPGTLTNFLSLCRWTWLTWRGLTSWRRRPTDGSSSTCWRRCWHSTPTNGSRPWRRWTIHSLPWRTCCTSLTAHSKTTRSAVDDQSRYRSMFSFATAAVKPPSVSLTVFHVFYSVKSCFQNMDICKRRCSAFENGKNMFASNNTPSAATNLTVTFSSQLNQHNQVRTLSVTCRRVFFFILLSNILLDPCWRFYRSLIYRFLLVRKKMISWRGPFTIYIWKAKEWFLSKCLLPMPLLQAYIFTKMCLTEGIVFFVCQAEWKNTCLQG